MIQFLLAKTQEDFYSWTEIWYSVKCNNLGCCVTQTGSLLISLFSLSLFFKSLLPCCYIDSHSFDWKSPFDFIFFLAAPHKNSSATYKKQQKQRPPRNWRSFDLLLQSETRRFFNVPVVSQSQWEAHRFPWTVHVTEAKQSCWSQRIAVSWRCQLNLRVTSQAGLSSSLHTGVGVNQSKEKHLTFSKRNSLLCFHMFYVVLNWQNEKKTTM